MTGGGDLDPDAVATLYLFPDYLRFKDAGGGRTYTWNDIGKVNP